MFGRVIHRDRALRGIESDRLIASGKRWLCQDWHCPASASCARHWGRSRAYAAMADYTGALVQPPRDAGDESCEHYVRDKPRSWLQPTAEQFIQVLPPALGMRR